MEGQLLPGETAPGADALLLRRAPRDGGDQLHLLSDAEPEDDRGLGRRYAPGLHVRPQGAAADHTHRAPPGHRRSVTLFPGAGPQARHEARSRPVPAAPQLQEGPAPAGRPPDAVPARPALRLGVPPRVLVLR